MTLLKPIKFTNQPILLTLSPDFQYYDLNLQVNVKSTLHAVMIFDLKEGETEEIKVPDFSKMDERIFTVYIKVQQFLNICANAGERINYKLLTLLPIMAPESRASDLLKLDFMKLRNEFSERFKKNLTYRLDVMYDSSEKINKITSTFYDFVLCRNYYTHGVLKVLLPTEKYYIEYIEEGKEKITAEINQNILQSFLDTADDIAYVLDQIRSFHERNRSS